MLPELILFPACYHKLTDWKRTKIRYKFYLSCQRDQTFLVSELHLFFNMQYANLTILMLSELLVHESCHVARHIECLTCSHIEKIISLQSNKFAGTISNLFISKCLSFCFFQMSRTLEWLLQLWLLMKNYQLYWRKTTWTMLTKTAQLFVCPLLKNCSAWSWKMNKILDFSAIRKKWPLTVLLFPQ